MIPIVSIIVTTHAVESAIQDCLQSLQQQTLKAIEVLIMNDGSSEETARICEAFANEDSRFSIMNAQSLTLSEARNYGMHIATGKYIAFVDGHDFVECTMYEKLVKCAKQKQADLVLCGYTKYWPKSKYKRQYKVNAAILTKSNPVDYFLAKHNEAYVMPCNKLFLRSIILEHQLYFDNPTFFEHVGFMARYLSFAKVIAIVNEAQYNQVQYADMLTKSYHPSIAQSQEQMYIQMKQFFDKRQYRNVIEALNLRMYIHRYHYVLLTTANTRHLKSLERQIIREGKNFSQLSWKHRLMKPLVKLRLYPTFFRLVHKVKAE